MITRIQRVFTQANFACHCTPLFTKQRAYCSTIVPLVSWDLCEDMFPLALAPRAVPTYYSTTLLYFVMVAFAETCINHFEILKSFNFLLLFCSASPEINNFDTNLYPPKSALIWLENSLSQGWIKGLINLCKQNCWASVTQQLLKNVNQKPIDQLISKGWPRIVTLPPQFSITDRLKLRQSLSWINPIIWWLRLFIFSIDIFSIDIFSKLVNRIATQIMVWVPLSSYSCFIKLLLDILL